jgi:hypothetical protein
MNDSDPKPKLTPKQVLESLLLEADHDDALDHSREASDEEIDARLREAGIDLDAIESPDFGVAPVRADGHTAKPAVAEASPVIVEAPRRGTFAIWLAAAAAAASALAGTGILTAGGILGGGYAALPNAQDHGASQAQYANLAGATPSSSPVERAIALRRDALAACGKKQWYDCKDKLDDAWRLDPAGEGTPDVRAARETASREIEIRENEARAKQ